MAKFLKAALTGLALLIAACVAAPAQDSVRPQLDQAKQVLDAIDASLKSESLNDADLQRLRSENDPVVQDLRTLAAKLAPLQGAEQKRLDELTPKPAAGAPVGTPAPTPAAAEEAIPELAAEKAKFDALDANLRSARALIVQGDDNAARIAAKRRALFANQTFARSQSLLSPSLWIGAMSDLPGALAQSGGLLRDWLARLSLRQAWQLALLMGALLALGAPIGFAARNVIARDPAVPNPSPTHRALAAVATALVLAVLPLLALGALSFGLDVLDISDPRLQAEFDALFDGLRVVIVSNAIARAVLAPGLPQWRAFQLADESAGALLRLWVGCAAIYGLERLLEPVADSVSSLNLSILLRALAAALIGALTALTVWRSLYAARIIKSPGQLAVAARAFGWGLAAALAGSAALGFIAFATYLIKESLFASAMGAALFLFDALVQASGDWLVARWAPPARSGQPPGGPLTQTVVLGQGLVRLATIAFAMLLVLAPWGIQSTDMLGTLREAYQGVPVGGTVVSLASILAAAGVFAFVVFLSRTGRNWLAARYLPQTRLDAGLRNTISTVTGYVGVVVALALAGGQLGLDFQKVTIVAGALSVGIGFGLQAIVNNFVSGLILLLERGIRVGDFIVVGAEQGFVRRINARATEIETIDRATLIVPNSLLVSNSVKNWMYADRVARIIVSVNVAYETDPEAAQALLIAAAKAQELVMAIPAPLVLFHEFADWALKFQLICFVDDVMLAERVRSELNFDVMRRMREAGMRVPYPK